ncbi:MAG: tRNA 2-thiocytidine biosynthesis protein TtcA [Polyangiales bacterium]
MSTKDPVERQLAHQMGRCIADFSLIEDGDRVMVCLSGGKDSYALAHLLERSRRRAPIKFSLVMVHLDQGHPGYDGAPLENWMKDRQFEYEIVRRDTYSVVKRNIPEGKTTCSLCSRLRRGILYDVASRLECSKIALGHHGDDAVETLLMNMMFNGSLGAMPPKLISDDKRHTVIRPLMYCQEKDLAAFSTIQNFPILPCDLCGSQPNLWRQEVKKMVTDLEKRIPQVRQSMVAALGNVRPTHLMDRTLLEAAGVPTGQVELGETGAEPAAGTPAPTPSVKLDTQERRLLPLL